MPGTRHERESATPVEWIEGDDRRGLLVGDCACGYSYAVSIGWGEFERLENAQRAHEQRLTRVADLAGWSATAFDPPHPVTDPDKVRALADDMAEWGWQGPPLLVDGADALTGSHRLAAARAADVELVPVVTVDEVLDAFDLDRVMLAGCGDVYTRAMRLRVLLPGDVVAFLGVDAH